VSEGGARLTRRQLLGLAGAAAAGAVAPAAARAQAPKRGGTIAIRGVDPLHFDPMLTSSFKTHTAISFTHSRLVRHKAGPSVTPGTFPLEGDLAESWTQPNETTYVFKLRRGVRWQPKPPVNGRELTAEDVRYSLERFLTVPGNVLASTLRLVERVEAPDRSTVRVTLKEPSAWFLDMLAAPMAVAIVAKECVERFGDLKKTEACVGSGPWMLDGYKPNQSLSFVRNPNYFVQGLPYIDRVEATVDEDAASRMSSFIAGKWDIGYDGGVVFRTEWAQIRDALRQRRPTLRTTDVLMNIMSHMSMRTDAPPFNDVRVRRAISLAVDRQAIMDATSEGTGALNPPVPAGLKDWSLPVAQLGDGARYYTRDLGEARRLLAAAGHANGLPASVCFTTYGSAILIDQAQLLLAQLKEAGIDARLDQKEYGALLFDVLRRQVRFDGVRPAAELSRARRLSGAVPTRRGAQPEPRRGRRGDGSHPAAAPHPGPNQAPRADPRAAAASGRPAVLRRDPLGPQRRRVGGGPEELRPQPWLRRGRPAHRRMAGSLRSAETPPAC
jgi:peptide/nickel transport system substrate-binding protein